MLRIFFNIGEQLKKFYWFEMKSTDLYWGPSFKTKFAKPENGLIDTTNFLEIFPNIKSDIVPKNIKYSYHESGQMHIKDNEGILNKSYWLKCQEILEPKLIYGIITKEFQYYPDFNKKLGKKGVSNYIIKIPEKLTDKRLYLEFFISTKENIDIPKFTFNIDENLKTGRLIIKLNDTYFLHVHFIGIEAKDLKLDGNNELFYFIENLK